MASIVCRTKILLTITLLSSAISSAATLPAGRPWTVQDSVAVHYYITNWLIPSDVGAASADEDPIQYSADGEHFFFVSFHGDVRTDRTIYELWIYSTAAVKRALLDGSHDGRSGLPPLRKLDMESGFPGSVDSAAIYVPRWETNRTITFVGTEGRHTRRIYRYDITSAKLTALTEPRFLVPDSAGANHAVRGTSIMFMTFYNARQERNSYPFEIVDTQRLQDLSEQDEDTHWRYHASYKGAPAKVAMEGRRDRPLNGPWISPDEKWAVLFCRPHDWQAPAEWSGYAFAGAPYWFMLINLETGLSRPLLHAPPGAGRLLSLNRVTRFPLVYEMGQAFWSADSQHLLVFNTALPLDTKVPDRRDTAYVIDYDLETARWTIVDVFARGDTRIFAQPAWLDEGRSLIVSYYDQPIGGKRIRDSIYRFDGRRWTARPGAGEIPPSQKPTALTISLRQSANEPPRMAAAMGQKEITLSDSDPALQDVWRAPVETIYWKDFDGREVESLLMLPRDFSTEKRSPLVVQLSDLRNPPDAFLPDGQPGTGFAAQALVAQGFVVLQMEPAGFLRPRGADRDIYQTPNEGPAQVRRVDAAVEMLRRRGVFDDAPIGLVGFSRSGYYVYYIVTHPGQTRIGAAVVFDSITYGYGDYVGLAAWQGAGEVKHYGLQYGNGKGFWQNKQGWLDAPAFNLERLKTPVLFHITGDPVWALETVGAFQIMRRPFEYHYHPGAKHELQAPRQREAAMQSTVDWMAFWLQDREREAPDQPDRFRRWRNMRADWQQTLAAESSQVAP